MFNDPEIGAKGMSDNQYARQNSFVSIEKLQTYISTCKGTIGSFLRLFNGFAKCIKYNASAWMEVLKILIHKNKNHSVRVNYTLLWIA